MALSRIRPENLFPDKPGEIKLGKNFTNAAPKTPENGS
jgi:hypothetical protein